ncbi:MAG: C25 family cysteine peptidase [Thermoplasmatota archaeon]
MLRSSNPVPSRILLAVFVAGLLFAASPSIGSEDGAPPAPSRKGAFLELSFSSRIVLDPSAGLWLDDVQVSVNGTAEWGFTDEDREQVVYDPEPCSPMLPWISTVVRTRSDIVGHSITKETEQVRLPIGELRTMPRATNPWEPRDETGICAPREVSPMERLQWSSPGYQRIDGELHRVYTIYYLPFTFHGPAGVRHIHHTTVDMELSNEMTEPTPSRIEGDPGLVPGTLSVTEFLDLPPEYLIITGEENKDVLSELACWRNEMGIPTSVVTVGDITSAYNGGGDDADLMRQYIKDVLDGWGVLKYVLLAGDWETVPVKSVLDSNAYSGWDDGTIPADSYFQCLDGTWDRDGDGDFAEPGDIEDAIPDLVVSRLAIDDPKIWEEKIQQIKDYETGESGAHWSESALLIGANTHNEGDGNAHNEYLWNKYLDNIFTDKMAMYEDEGTLSRSDVDQALEGGVSFVQFVDHGGPTVWCDDYGAGVVYTDRDAEELTNGDMLPFVSTLACLTTWFDDTSGCPSQRFSDSLGEAFTENTNGGSLAYVGSSRTSVGILGMERYLPYDNGLQEDIARQLGGLSVFDPGSIHTSAKKHYAESWSREFSNPNNPEVSMCWLEFTLLGEPLTSIWTSDARELFLNVEHEDDLDPHIVIGVTDLNGEPVPDVNITLQNFNRGVFERGISDQDGLVEFDLVLDWFCDINLTASKHNHMLYKDYISISDVIPPETELLTTPEEPDGENGWFLQEPEVRFLPNEIAVVHYSFGSSVYNTLNGSGNYSLGHLGEGEHSVHFFGEDLAGNLETEKHRYIKVDVEEPNVTHRIVPEVPNGDNGWYSSEPQVTLYTPENDTGSPVEMMFRTDDSEWQIYEYPFFVPEGVHVLRYKARDASGRGSEPVSLDLKVDTTPPETMISIKDTGEPTPDGWYTRTPRIELSSSETGARMEYRLNRRESFRDYTNPFFVPDGDHELQFRSVDPSGNIGPTNTVDIKVDTEAPTVQYTIDPPLPDGMNGYHITRPSVDIECLDNLDAEIFVRMDGGEWVKGLDTFDIDDGEHSIEVYSADRAGNTCPVEEMIFKVDTRRPETSFSARGSRNGEWFTSGPMVRLTSEEDASIRYRWEEDGQDKVYDSPLKPPEKEGIFHLSFYSIDRAGNQEESTLMTLKVDTRDPVLRVDTLSSGRDRITIDCSGSTDGTTLRYRVLEGDEVLADWTERSLIPVDPGPGEHTLTVEAKDSAGNTDSMEVDVYVEPLWKTVSKIALPISVLVGLIVLTVVMLIRSRRGPGRRHQEPYGAPVAEQTYEALETDN